MSEEIDVEEGVIEQDNLMAALSYLLMPLTGILIYFGEKEDEFVRFHAKQASIVGAILLIMWVALGVFDTLILVLVGWLIIPIILVSLFSLIPMVFTFVLWIFLMYKAYSGERFKLPFVGDLAEKKFRR